MTHYFLDKKILILVLAILGMGQWMRPTSNPVLAQESIPDLPSVEYPEQEQTDLLLYGGPRTRSPLVQWYLEELEVPYQYVSLDIQAEEHRQPEFLDINPMGKVPAMVDGDFKIWESGAILLYLADKYGELPDSMEERAVVNQWVIFANATLGPGLFREDRRDREMPRLLAPLNDILAQQPFILGSEMSVADVAIGSYLYYAKILIPIDVSAYPAVETYINQLSERTAFRNTIGQR